ncbi:hypothetical protein ACGF3J_37255 [Streptomyces sp. NPDC048171]|uniref:hypothetical protein n=1 Tax=Streptomyces sp. NPDC048171 TaxID=3365504 RepID=UPI003720B00F
MTSATQEVTARVLDVLVLPGLDDLTDDQVRGADCVWCRASLTADVAVDFGEHTSPSPWSTSTIGMRWYPRACPACTAERAHRGLFEHAPSCEQCVDAAERCEISRALYRLIREGRR